MVRHMNMSRAWAKYSPTCWTIVFNKSEKVSVEAAAHPYMHRCGSVDNVLTWIVRRLAATMIVTIPNLERGDTERRLSVFSPKFLEYVEPSRDRVTRLVVPRICTPGRIACACCMLLHRSRSGATSWVALRGSSRVVFDKCYVLM